MAGELIDLGDSALRVPVEGKIREAAVRIARELLDNSASPLESRLLEAVPAS